MNYRINWQELNSEQKNTGGGSNDQKMTINPQDPKSTSCYPPLSSLHWYPFEDMLTLIPPPENVTSRHMAIEREVKANSGMPQKCNLNIWADPKYWLVFLICLFILNASRQTTVIWLYYIYVNSVYNQVRVCGPIGMFVCFFIIPTNPVDPSLKIYKVLYNIPLVLSIICHTYVMFHNQK